jgi:hypothetical protein
MRMKRLDYADTMVVLITILSISLSLMILWQAIHSSAQGVHTVGNRVYDGSTLIGVCGGNPPTAGELPASRDDTDVTWYAECPR